MAVENGEWTMYGMEWDDPRRIHSYKELIDWINEIGFVPFFKNEIEGFSVEEHTSNLYWWTGNKEQDPWEWRELVNLIKFRGCFVESISFCFAIDTLVYISVVLIELCPSIFCIYRMSTSASSSNVAKE